MTIVLSGCAKTNNDIKDEPNSPITEVAKEGTVGYTLFQAFDAYVTDNADKSAYEIAEVLAADESLPFMGVAMEVEPGLLNGFDNYEVKNFEEGALFAPMIGTIPFVGYIFKLADDVDVEAFKKELSENANLRWTICTEAEQMVVANNGNIVFFLMSVEHFEEA